MLIWGIYRFNLGFQDLFAFMKKLLILSFLFLIAFAKIQAQEPILISNVVDGTFYPEYVRGLNWMNDGNFYTVLEENKIKKFSVRSGKEVKVLVDGNDLGLLIDSYTFSTDETKVLLATERKSLYRRSFTAVYFAYDLKKEKSLGKVADKPCSYATFSPVDNRVAFVQDNNLFISDLKGNIQAVTTDGATNTIINGSTDWVYEEELFLTKAFEWSPDGQYLAYYRFDESHVKEYNMQVWEKGALYPSDYRYKYPKAGEQNSEVQIWVYQTTEKSKTLVDIGEEKDIYIPRIRWTKDSEILSVQRLNRHQNQLDILHASSKTGESELILREESSTYVDFTFCDDLLYLDNGEQFLYSSEKDGYKHFYLHQMDGSLVNQITKGNWDAEEFLGLDQKNQWLYYLSTEESHLERHLYRVRISGDDKEKLTAESGNHHINMSSDTQYFMDYFHSSTEALSVKLYSSKKNVLVKVLKENQALLEKAKQYGFASKEFFTFETPEGVSLDGYFLKPKDFAEAKTYPVLIYQYSGPGSQSVSNGWGGAHFAWHQLLVQQGYIIAVIDNRGTGGRGEDFKKMTYKQLGKMESEDHISAAKFLGTLPFVDAERIGIWGWSYGGYISSLALFKGADVFKTAIAVAPVTTWRFYDTIYTERYLQRPQDNPTGYDDNSPINHVNKLKGNFLLIHGTGDDNVHFQNSVALQNELIKANKQFSSFYYPDLAHGLVGPNSRNHLYQMMTDFILENL